MVPIEAKQAIAQLCETVIELRRENFEIKQTLADMAGAKKATEQEIEGLKRQAESAEAAYLVAREKDEKLFAQVDSALSLLETEE